MDSRCCIWRSEEEDRDVTLYLDATLTHLFKTTQMRTFDLRCKPLSRYMLAMNFTPTSENLKVGTGSITYSHNRYSTYSTVCQYICAGR